jgi:hypothetical protein
LSKKKVWRLELKLSRASAQQRYSITFLKIDLRSFLRPAHFDRKDVTQNDQGPYSQNFIFFVT